MNVHGRWDEIVDQRISSQIFQRIHFPEFEVYLGSIEKAQRTIYRRRTITLVTSHRFESVGKLKKFASGASEKK